MDKLRRWHDSQHPVVGCFFELTVMALSLSSFMGLVFAIVYSVVDAAGIQNATVFGYPAPKFILFITQGLMTHGFVIAAFGIVVTFVGSRFLKPYTGPTFEV